MDADCVARQTLRDDACLVPCNGLYADISDDSFERKTTEGVNLEYPDVKNICFTFRIAFVEQWPPPLWQLWLSRRSVPASPNGCSLHRKEGGWA